MKNFKKILCSLVLAFSLFCSFTLIACGSKTDETSNETQNETPEAPKTMSVIQFKNRVNTLEDLFDCPNTNFGLDLTEVKYSTVSKELGGEGKIAYNANFEVVPDREDTSSGPEATAPTVLDTFMYGDIAKRLGGLLFKGVKETLITFEVKTDELFKETTPISFSVEGGSWLTSSFAIQGGISLKLITLDNQSRIASGYMLTALFDKNEEVSQVIVAAVTDKSTMSDSSYELIYNYGVYDARTNKNYGLTEAGRTAIIPKITEQFNAFKNSQNIRNVNPETRN